MSQNKVNQFPTENFSVNNIQLILLVVGFVEFFLLRLLTDRKKISQIFLGFQSSIQSFSISSSETKDCVGVKESVSESSSKQEKRNDQIVDGGDVDIVLRSLGMLCGSGEGKLQPSFDADDLSSLFIEEIASLDEVKDAFDVFDSNRDGFIDAKELQKVLCALGLKEGTELEKCTRMIAAFDENGDGRIDFDEFVKFIETSLC